MPTSVPRAVLLRFDGIVHTSDLPTQAFARHLAETLPAEQNARLIGGMRGFLEAKSELIPADIDLSAAEDGDQAVEILARAAGLAQPTIDRARAEGRRDLAASVWAVDAADGLDELLAAVDGGHLAVLGEPDDPAAAALLASEEIAADELILGPIGAAIERLVVERLVAERDGAVERVGDTVEPRGEAEPRGITVVSTRWSGELAVAQQAGCVTVLVDRRGTGRGTPTVRCATLREAAAAIRNLTTAEDRGLTR